MFKLSKDDLAVLSDYKWNVIKDKNHAKSELYDMMKNLTFSQKKELFELCDHPDTDMRRFSSIHMKGELGLKSLIAISQVTNHDPAFISGSNKDETLMYTRESVCACLRQYGIGSLCSVQSSNK